MILNTIYNEDCLEGMKRLPDGRIDLTVTSPPYDNLRTYNGYSWDFEGVAKELYRVTKDGGVVVWIVADATVKGSETGTSFKQALFFKECGFNLHDTMIWSKDTFTATGSLKVRYGSTFEYMFVLSKGKPKTFNPIKDRKNKYAKRTVHGTVRQQDGTYRRVVGSGKKRVAEFGQRFNVWDIPSVKRPSERNGHPAQFPERLVTDHIISWSNEGDVVLDPFMGSGTTAKMAMLNGRHYIGYEVDEGYCEIARRRISEIRRSEV